jgi:hypothetical protein
MRAILLFGLPVVLLGFLRAEPPPPEWSFPEDSTAVVLEFDWIGGYTPPRKTKDPYLRIRADGSVTLINPFKNEPPIRSRMTQQQISELMNFVTERQGFLRLTDADIREAADAERKARGIESIPDVPTTVIRIFGEDEMHEVRCFASMLFTDPISKYETLRRFVAVETRLTKYMDQLRDRPPALDPPDPSSGEVVPKLTASRSSLSHGRADSLRREGYFTPFRKVGQRNAMAKLAVAISDATNPLRISLKGDERATLTEHDVTTRIRQAAEELPSGMTFLVVELGDSRLNQSIVRWNAPADGTLYAAVSIPAAGIAAGMPLVTKKALDGYVANSIVWEAPSFGNTVMPHTQAGGSTNVSLTAARGKKRSHLEHRINWADPLEMVLSEVGQKTLDDGSTLVRLRTAIPEGFETDRIVRWSAMPHTAPHMFGESELKETDVFAIRFPKEVEGLTQIRVVTTPVKPGFLNPIPSQGSGFFDTILHSRGPTLEDVISVNIRPNPIGNIQDALDKAKAKGGDVQVSLYWNSKDDLDLHVVAPSGEEISYSHRKSKCNGVLDVDMNVNYANAVVGAVENIYWPTGKAPQGKYRIFVVPYSHHGGSPGTADPAHFSVRLVIQGRGQSFQGNVSFSPNAIRKKVHVHDFEVP